MKKILMLALSLMLLATPCFAEEIKLFKNYSYGMSKEQVEETTNLIPCEAATLEGDLCTPHKITFLGEEWIQAFYFHNDELRYVGLFSTFTEGLLHKSLQGISQNGFVLMHIVSDSSAFDAVPYLPEGRDITLEALSTWEHENQNSQAFTYSLVEEKNLKQMIVERNVKSTASFIHKAPITTRMVEIELTSMSVTVKFLAPIKALEDHRKENQVSKEEF